MSRSACFKCGSPVRFVRTQAGASMPVDPEPDEHAGNVIIQGGRARQLSDSSAVDARAQGYELWISHFATCPVEKERRRTGEQTKLDLPTNVIPLHRRTA